MKIIDKETEAIWKARLIEQAESILIVIPPSHATVAYIAVLFSAIAVFVILITHLVHVCISAKKRNGGTGERDRDSESNGNGRYCTPGDRRGGTRTQPTPFPGGGGGIDLPDYCYQRPRPRTSGGGTNTSRGPGSVGSREPDQFPRTIPPPIAPSTIRNDPETNTNPFANANDQFPEYSVPHENQIPASGSHSTWTQ